MSRKTTIGEQLYQPEGSPDDFQAELEAEQLRNGSRTIRGGFSNTAVGRQLAFFARQLDKALIDGNRERAVYICEQAEWMTSDPQWAAVRVTLQATGGAA